MAKQNIVKVQVQGIDITIDKRGSEDFISLSDIASGFEGGSALIEKWIRNKNTIEFLAVWEQINNPSFNSPEFEGIKNEAGTNRFIISVKQWIQKTGAVGITATAGRYGGTYAHRDIATEFCSWLSPAFKLYLLKEFQRLKEAEAQQSENEWNLKRVLSKVNYRIHTDSIKEHLIPSLNISKEKEGFVYADEAELLNIVMFDMTSKEWKQKNSDLTLKGYNIRDTANLHQLTVLSNLESYNSILIRQGYPKEARLYELRRLAVEQLTSLYNSNTRALESLMNPKLPTPKNKPDEDKG
jgi:hypothetical protein